VTFLPIRIRDKSRRQSHGGRCVDSGLALDGQATAPTKTTTVLKYIIYVIFLDLHSSSEQSQKPHVATGQMQTAERRRQNTQATGQATVRGILGARSWCLRRDVNNRGIAPRQLHRAQGRGTRPRHTTCTRGPQDQFDTSPMLTAKLS